ncbi:hypothetical protein E8D34_06715 [Nocardioides sp. GY 10113]|uniref:hypothetical protein n=1 Tax=Nocardioides sp. GY 10113 TaxID=2569761 RepID=UPI0010A91B77|nr:hypothetical protein [Nocardioides sp. GY 10113]TIC87978.1 hypothetical protein E8D34_06715 [Nocardioides sp. GY 10113]
MSARPRALEGTTGAFLAYLAIAAVLLTALAVRLGEERGRVTRVADAPASTGSAYADGGTGDGQPGEDPATDPAGDLARPAAGPRWRSERIFAPGRTLVAYYGTAGTGALGVLGERDPDASHRRLVRAARPFAGPAGEVQPVYELIVTIADAHPGRDGDFNHDLRRAAVRRYLDAAGRHGALVLLDVQPGRGDFERVARRWAWALRQPHVGLALDPEWRMGRHQVPGRVLGSVRAAEVNRVSAWLSAMVVRRDLPEKLLVVHQFRTSMLPDAERVRARDGLALVQHVDGFGTPRQKLDTYRAVARPRTFRMGFKLFYDEDSRLMRPRDVAAVRPRVRFVSYQ